MGEDFARDTAPTEAGAPTRDSRERGLALGLPERYEDLGLLGSGGFGEVRRVWDRRMKRAVAMKILRPDLGGAELRARFLAEIEVTARLSHPGIVAVHDHGELADGRLWFTMAEIEGRTLRAVIDEVSRDVDTRRLLDLFARVCETVAYAHDRGVIHRDLKPENVMIGPFAQVLVMDWGIARRIGEHEEPPPREAPSEPGGAWTRAGDVLGTPAYMAPEQAFGEVQRHGPATDVYALGAVLFHVLVGKPPPSAWARVSLGEVLSLDEARGVAPELAAICHKATRLEAHDRYHDAGALSAEIVAFLDGARRRERALEALAEAQARGESLAEVRAKAQAEREEALRALVGVRPFDPVEDKLAAWEREDRADALEREAALGEVEWIQAVQAALVIEPSLVEAHEALADHYHDKLVEAERARRAADVARFEVLLRAHDRGRHAAFLRGDGAFTLVTDPPGARVIAHRYVASKRRLVLTPFADLGETPLRAVTLPHGSYVLIVTAPGRGEVRYPVQIERGGHWEGIAPGESAPFPIVLPAEGALGPEDVYVPAGFAWTGGDPQAGDSLPRRRIWVDAFVSKRFAATNGELLVFLNDVAASNPSNESLGLPRAHPGVIEVARVMPGIGYDERRGFFLREDGPDAPLQERWPANVDGHLAVAYSCWLSRRTGKPWRLPDEIEREKAARGVDGRLFPWGDQPEPTFACVLEVHRGEPMPRPVDDFPTDESPYTIRGLGGHVRDWCANVWRHEGPRVVEGRLEIEAADPEDDDFRAIKGGAWGSSITHARAAARFGNRPGVLRPFVGVRVACRFVSPWT